MPPPPPLQDHVHGPEPATALAVPAEHNPVDGAVALVTPLAVPQAPFNCLNALQDALWPADCPWHVHNHGPEPLTAVASPPAHKFADGAAVKYCPWDVPQIPSPPVEQTGLAPYPVLLPLNSFGIYERPQRSQCESKLWHPPK